MNHLRKILMLVFGALFLTSLFGCQSNRQAQQSVAEKEQQEIDWKGDMATEKIDDWIFVIKKCKDVKGIRIISAQYNGKDCKNLCLTVPSQIAGLTVRSVGESFDDIDDFDEFNHSFLGENVEEPHEGTGESELTKKIVKISLPDSLETIEASAFSGLTNLKEITLPGNLVNLGENAFYACRNLEKVTFSDSLATFAPDVFKGCNKLSDIQISEKNPNLYLFKNGGKH